MSAKCQRHAESSLHEDIFISCSSNRFLKVSGRIQYEKCLIVCTEWIGNKIVLFTIVGMRKRASNCEPLLTRYLLFSLFVVRQFRLFRLGVVGGLQNKCSHCIRCYFSPPYPLLSLSTEN